MIATQLDTFREQVRALAIEVGHGSVWVEKVKVTTAMLVDVAALKERNDPLGELVHQLEILATGDRQALEALAAELHSLRQKLPAEVMQTAEGLLLEDAQTLQRLCASLGSDLLLEHLIRHPVGEAFKALSQGIRSVHGADHRLRWHGCVASYPIRAERGRKILPSTRDPCALLWNFRAYTRQFSAPECRASDRWHRQQ